MENKHHKPRQASRNGQLATGLVIMLIGTAILLQREFQLHISHLILPGLIIGLGLWLLAGDRRSRKSDRPDYSNPVAGSDTQSATNRAADMYGPADAAFFRSTAVFSEQRRIVTAQPLRGGDIVNIFGGTDINLMQTTIREPVVIEIFQLFGGTKIIVPANWNVHFEVTSVFGEVDDRRFNPHIPKDKDQLVYLKGTSIFGGITVKSM